MKVGINFSSFDLFPAGHVKLLEEAKRKCDYLIIGLQSELKIMKKHQFLKREGFDTLNYFEN